MSDGELYAVEPDLPKLDRPVLLYHLSGFMDAGGAGRLVSEHLRASLEPRRVAAFDVDRLVDYRSRRPRMAFDNDHWSRYEAPELVVEACTDSVGTPFLVMTGPEPDFGWERFVADVISLARRLDVRLAIGVHGIPMAVPHTREAGITPHGNRRDLFQSHPNWINRAEVPGSAAALLEYRMAEAGHDAIGFAAHVPHYVAQSDYPPAAVALLEAITSATGLALPAAALREAADEARRAIDEQVTASEEIAEAVRGLERQFDAITATTRGARPLTDDRTAMPTGEEIAAQFERFLAEQDDDTD